ncbi:MAG: glycine betaine/L-proline ABC transporter ATP-binding protein ProV [Gemmatimonadota bacterium]
MGSADKIVVNHLSKIFGPRPEEALDLIEQGVHKDEIFARTQTTVGVRDVSLKIASGEVFVVMGLSGSGKSTLVRMLNRLIEPTVGEVLIEGEDITKMSQKELVQHRRENTAMVFQSFALLPHLTAAENAAFGLEVAGLEPQKRHDRAMEVLREVGLEDYANSYPDELSGGMKQRVGLARALAVDPSIMLMDEAYSALDPLIRREMQEELLELQAQKERTVVFISHDLDEAMRVGDRIAMMEGGSVTQVGTPREILDDPAADYIRAFFQDVDIGEIYTADYATDEDIVAFGEDKTDSSEAMRRTLEEQGAEYGYIVDDMERFLGVVSTDSLEYVDRGDVKAAYLPDPTVVRSSEPLSRILGKVASTRYPVPVLKRNRGFVGAVSRDSLLSTLGRKT